MSEIIFTASASGEFSDGRSTFGCVLGRGGVIAAAEKREGDGASPLGVWTMRRVFYRPDRGPRPETQLPIVPLKSSDGWCDAADHPPYNRPVTLPFPASREKLWRADAAYDLIVELGYNDDPVIPGSGSAIFLHLMHADSRPTAGCVALNRADMLAVLKVAMPGSSVEICQ